MKIGIITHYYKSTNYGGNLQAFALCRCLNKMGDDAEQICFQYTAKRSFLKRLVGKNIFKTAVIKVKAKLIHKKIQDENLKYNVIERHVAAFEDFNQNVVPNSGKVYDSNNINACVNCYDAFITGSDQVWNVTWYYPEFFLDFVPSDKIKLSYAASIAKSRLTEEQKNIFRKSLRDYRAVSVREKSAEDLIKDLSPVPVQTVLDPTLILEKEDWDNICSDRVVNEDYVFCYFLGENKCSRRLAEDFARKNNLKLVTIPHSGGAIKLADRDFGEIKLFDATPNDFISLIKHAKYVFTDSFHAVVFSYIYQKQYFIFNRDKSGSMSSRITDITELFGTQERFCFSKARESVGYIEALEPIDYTKENPTFDELKKKSIDFLKDNLGGQT